MRDREADQKAEEAFALTLKRESAPTEQPISIKELDKLFRKQRKRDRKAAKQRKRDREAAKQAAEAFALTLKRESAPTEQPAAGESIGDAGESCSKLKTICYPVYLAASCLIQSAAGFVLLSIQAFLIGSFLYVNVRGWYAIDYDQDLGEYIVEAGNLPVFLQIADQLYEHHTQQLLQNEDITNETIITNKTTRAYNESTACSTVTFKGEEYQVPGNCESYLTDVYVFIGWFYFIVLPFLVTLCCAIPTDSETLSPGEDSNDGDDKDNEKQDGEDDEADAVLEATSGVNEYENIIHYQSRTLVDAEIRDDSVEPGSEYVNIDEASDDLDQRSTITRRCYNRVGNLFPLSALALAMYLCILVPNSKWALRTAVTGFYIPWYLFTLALIMAVFIVLPYVGFNIFLGVLYLVVNIIAILLECFGYKLDIPDLDIGKIYEYVFALPVIAWEKLKSIFCNTVSVNSDGSTLPPQELI